MEPFILAAAVAIVIFIVALAVMPKAISNESESRTRTVLQNISTDDPTAEDMDILPELGQSKAVQSPIGRMLLVLPGAKSLYVLMLKSGYANKITGSVIAIFVLAFVIGYVLSLTKLGNLGFLFGIPAGYFLAKKYFNYKVDQRNDKFINDFPDAIDMIVRSVKSGHPLNTSFRMIVDNMGPPISTEFRQVIDEVAYGRTMTEALQRLAQRVDQPDLNFFVVVLSVQQETGGNLAEVLGNLSNIIRKRRQLFKKIRALTSEGRMTGWILAGLPIGVFGVLYVMQPDYLEPLFVTVGGQVILGSAIGLIVLALWIAKQMVDIDI